MHVLMPALLCAALLAAGPAAAGSGARPPRVHRVPAPPGIDTTQVRLAGAGSAGEAFVAWPVGREHAPGIVVAHEWWGLDDPIRDVAVRLAQQGYVAIVPDLYHGRVADDLEGAQALARGLDDADALPLMGAAVKWLADQPRTAGQRTAVIGFCTGGGLAERFALGTGGLAAVVVFYGPPVTAPEELAKLSAPLQGHFGAEDDGIPPDRVEALRRGLQRAGRRGEIYVYPGAGHAFMHEGLDSYRPDAARQAWARTLAFLQTNLKGR